MDNLTFWFIGFIICGLIWMARTDRFSPDARERRKRKRNYGRVIAKSKRPMVTLSVNTLDAG